MGEFHTQSTASSLSSRKFNLDENDDSDILVYRLRDGYSISSQRDLCKELDKSPQRKRCSRKPIPRGASRVTVQTKDLFNEPERSAYSTLPNASCSLASVGLPRAVYWRRLVMGHFQDLYIVSPDNSPEGSSRGNSPIEERALAYDEDHHDDAAAAKPPSEPERGRPRHANTS